MRHKQIRYAISPGTKPLFSRIIISASSSEAIRRLCFNAEEWSGWLSKEVVQTDALEILNLPVSAPEILGELIGIGTNPRYFRLADVEELAGEVISMGEIRCRWGGDARPLRRELTSAGLQERAKGCFDGTAVERFFQN
jgi:hypothetical protein